MTWRETLATNSVGGKVLRGSFRGAEFLVRTDDLDFGRRTQVHEYPQRDLPYVEDLGRKGRRFAIEVFVAGNDYLAARDRLIGEIEQPGPGTLVHPYYGTMRVTIVESRVRHSSREGGMATFTLTCIEGGELAFPTVSADTTAAVDDAADAATAAATEDFAGTWSVDGLPGWSLAELEEDLARTLAQVDEVVGGVTSAVAAEIRAPYNMAAQITGSIAQLRDTVGEPLRALRLYEDLFDAGDDSPAVPTTTTARYTQAQDSAALHRLTQQSALIEASRAAAEADHASVNDAMAVRDTLLDAFDKQMEAPIGGALFDALSQLRAVVVEDLRVRAAQLPRVTHYTPTATLPALVLAYKIYGKASRAEEIVARNKIRHPGFVTGGVALEVLTDA